MTINAKFVSKGAIVPEAVYHLGILDTVFRPEDIESLITVITEDVARADIMEEAGVGDFYPRTGTLLGVYFSGCANKGTLVDGTMQMLYEESSRLKGQD